MTEFTDPTTAEPAELAELAWGSHYAVVEPTHFRIDYAINPFMDPDVQPDPARASDQWAALVGTLRGLGARIDVLPQREDAPDMVYAMNLGLALLRTAGDPHVVMSHMRYPQRRMETGSAQQWFAGRGWTTSYVGREGVGAHLEAGDAFAFGDALVVGFGPRTEELALKHLALELGVRVRGLRLTHPGMYHLDLAFCPLDSRRALVCPAALDAPSARALMELVPEPLVLTEQEALTTFAANSVVVGRTVVMPACPARVRAQLESWGFEVVVVEVSEFHKGGGSIRCLTNPLDVTLGRDLPVLARGEVITPPPA
ncbi:dimethylarginine dimethylaminohydrolase family protein [Nocardioides sp. cx-173]|uniref:dimethylarginine dimethylaminohydrolase family protein n=1 Tax=Nocardioides sp. cx-173 TaxID=2898796 RepID=UPI001E59CE1F|nr:arginine deiminase-related protein [Nocardioides sp. cx-173]MCD4523902.1 arginine deiminase-related protein [Nocardioides sp. cx-173]UGB41779.1 arginine deiminase-related protein [Nocardioides sp. cx-173]